MKRWKERLCIISIVFNWHSTSVSSTEFNTELNTICTVRFRLQFSFTIQFTISTYNFVWQIRTYNSANNWPYNFGWPKWVKRPEHPSSDSTVVQSGCLVPRPSLADVSRIGRSNGKGNPWQGQFLVALSVDRFPIMDLSPGPTPATLNRKCWCRWFYTYSRCVLARTRVSTRNAFLWRMDYFVYYLRSKVFKFWINCFYLRYFIRIYFRMEFGIVSGDFMQN